MIEASHIESKLGREVYVTGAARHRLNTRAGCCTWETFLDDFAEKWPRWFKERPTQHQWSMADKDWRSGNTGYEAAHNAQRRIAESNTPAAHQRRTERALARSNVLVTGQPLAGPVDQRVSALFPKRDS